MNFFSSDTRLLRFDVDAISVTTQYWISLKRLMKTSRFDVILIAEKEAEKGDVLISLEHFTRSKKGTFGRWKTFLITLNLPFYVRSSPSAPARALQQSFLLFLSRLNAPEWRFVALDEEFSSWENHCNEAEIGKLGGMFFFLPRCKLFYSPGEKIEKIITSFR